jgi:Rsm1-like
LGIIASVETKPSIREQAGSEHAGEEEAPITRSSPPPEPSSTAILTSLFGWSLALPAPAAVSSTAASPSWSRASSVAPQETSAVPSFPHTPRRPSGLGGASQLRTPPSRAASCEVPIPSSPKGGVAPERRRDTLLLHCSLCLRRLGLWAVGSIHRSSNPTDGSPSSTLPQRARQIDLLKEHRPYCPYVVCSTTIPSLPVVPSSTPSFTSFLSSSSISPLHVDTQQSSAVEGWRAVLMVVLRYRMGQWQCRRVPKSVTERVDGGPDTTQPPQQSEVAPATSPGIDEESWVEIDPVEAMVERVKSRGVRSVSLRYRNTMNLTSFRHHRALIY